MQETGTWPSTREAAIVERRHLYFTGAECKYGHVAERYTVNGSCAVCARVRAGKDPEKNREKVRKWKAANPGAVKEQDRRRYPHRMTSVREALAGRPRPDICEVCAAPPKGKHRVLHWDHDHGTGAFRGWLCGNCNHALGNARDNPATLRALADYLERGPKDVAPLAA